MDFNLFFALILQPSRTTWCSPSISLWTLDSELVRLPLQQFLPAQGISPWYNFFFVRRPFIEGVAVQYVVLICVWIHCGCFAGEALPLGLLG
jgi:hypothetical protein